MILPNQYIYLLLFLILGCCSSTSAQSVFSTHRNAVVPSSYKSSVVKTNCGCKRICLSSMSCRSASVVPRDDGDLDCILADGSTDTSALDSQANAITFIKKIAASTAGATTEENTGSTETMGLSTQASTDDAATEENTGSTETTGISTSKATTTQPADTPVSCVTRSSVANCPTDWTVKANGCFRVLTDEVANFELSKTACVTNGGVIAQPCDILAIQTFAKSQVTSSMKGPKAFWLGIPIQESDLEYRYDNGFMFPDEDSVWKSGYPDHKPAHCINLFYQGEPLKTRSCKEEVYVICEYISS